MLHCFYGQPVFDSIQCNLNADKFLYQPDMIRLVDSVDIVDIQVDVV
jgi:hypothetical protein